MQSRSHSPERLRAQLADFAAASSDPAERDRVLGIAGITADQELATPSVELEQKIDRKAYVESIRASHRNERDEYLGRVANRAVLLKNYKYFSGSRDNIRMLDSGDVANVHTFSAAGRTYAGRHARRENMLPTIDNHALAEGAAQGIRSAERLVAISYGGKGETVSHFHEGTGIADLTIDQIKQIRYSQIQDLVTDVAKGGRAGVRFDVLLKPDNFIYDVKEGFRMLDLGVATPDHTNYDIKTPIVLLRLATYLGRGRTEDRIKGASSPQQFAAIAEELRARLPIIMGFRAACAELPEDAFGSTDFDEKAGVKPIDVAIGGCDSIIADIQAKLEVLQDPTRFHEIQSKKKSFI